MLTAFGFVLNMHYCGHLLTSVEINAPSKNSIKGEPKMKCCTDKQLIVKIKDAHQLTSTSFKANFLSFEVPQLPFKSQFFFASQPVTGLYLNKAPPDALIASVPVFIKNCAFLI